MQIKDIRWAEQLASHAFFNQKIECLPQRELLELQKKKLREVTKYAYENSPHYKKVFDKANVKPGDIRDISDLQKVQIFTTKDDLRENYPFGMLAITREKVV